MELKGVESSVHTRITSDVMRVQLDALAPVAMHGFSSAGPAPPAIPTQNQHIRQRCCKDNRRRDAGNMESAEYTETHPHTTKVPSFPKQHQCKYQIPPVTVEYMPGPQARQAEAFAAPASNHRRHLKWLLANKPSRISSDALPPTLTFRRRIRPGSAPSASLSTRPSCPFHTYPSVQPNAMPLVRPSSRTERRQVCSRRA